MESVVRRDVRQALIEAMEIPGALAVALIDIESGLVLGRAGDDALDLDTIGIGNSEVVRSKLRVRDTLGIPDIIEDIVITLTTQYHVIRTLQSESSLFLYLVLNRRMANLAFTRRSLVEIDRGLVV